jgi:hypothetical protein
VNPYSQTLLIRSNYIDVNDLSSQIFVMEFRKITSIDRNLEINYPRIRIQVEFYQNQ